jgi:hypothetical protein
MNANGTNGAKNRKTDEKNVDELLNQAQEFIEGSDKVPAQKNNEADGDALDSDIENSEDDGLDGESTANDKKAPSRLDKAKDLARRNRRPILFGVAATGVITMVSMARYFANKNAAVEIETEIPILTVTETITEG